MNACYRWLLLSTSATFTSFIFAWKSEMVKFKFKIFIVSTTIMYEIQQRPSVIYLENVQFDWFNQNVCKGEYFQSNLDIFQFDFMFVKPHDVPPLLCFDLQTEMRFGVEQLLFTTPTPPPPPPPPPGNRNCSTPNLISVCTLKQSSGGTSCGFTNIELNRNMSRSDWNCSLVHKYWLNQSKWTFST